MLGQHIVPSTASLSFFLTNNKKVHVQVCVMKHAKIISCCKMWTKMCEDQRQQYFGLYIAELDYLLAHIRLTLPFLTYACSLLLSPSFRVQSVDFVDNLTTTNSCLFVVSILRTPWPTSSLMYPVHQEVCKNNAESMQFSRTGSEHRYLNVKWANFKPRGSR